MPDPHTTLPPLPPGYRVLQVLTRGASAVTLHAAGPRGEVVLRLAQGAAAERERVRELAVLGAVRARGLAELVDHGLVERDTAFVARRFVAGVDLAEHARGMARADDARARELGAIVARVCDALGELHERGFVHADLKAENVIVGADLEPVLTDFGLAQLRGAERTEGAASGSFYSVAPEVLFGAQATPRSDLFALGVMLARLLVPRHATPAQFYARFPAVDALAALAIDAAELPPWSRDLVARLVERDPALRPASARTVAASLRARLALPRETGATRVALEWPVRTARAEFLRERFAHLSAALDAELPVCEWWTLPVGEDAALVVEDAHIAAGLDGVRTARFDPAACAALENAAALDQAVALEVARTADMIVLAALGDEDAHARVVEYWRRTARQARARGEAAPRALIVCATHAGGDPSSQASDAWTAVRVPCARAQDVEQFLFQALEETGVERRRELSEWIYQGTHGAAARIRARIDLLVESGLIQSGDERPRVRKGALPDPALRRSGTLDLPPSAREPAAVLAAAGAALPFALVVDACAQDAQSAARALGEAIAVGCVQRDARTGWLRFQGSALDLKLEARAWAPIEGRLCASLRAAQAPWLRGLPHAWAAARAAGELERTEVKERVLLAARETLQRGAFDAALDLFARLERAARRAQSPLEPEITGEHAAAWIAAGAVDRALDLARTLERDPAPKARGVAARIRGSAALQRAEYDEALAALAEAARIDEAANTEIALARARVLFDARRDTELDEHIAATLADPRETERGRGNLRALWALSRARRGEIERADELLAQASAVESLAADPLRAAAHALNSSTLERRRGRTEAALALAQRGLALYEEIGFLPGIAQARLFLGGLMRDAGRLIEAQNLLESAALVRERLGDHAGSAAARGMLGLTLADRGHARAALNELTRAAAELLEYSRRVDAALLDARAEEVRARIGEPATIAERGRTRAGAQALDADPRALLSRARAAWMRGDDASARLLAVRARDLAEALQQVPTRAEAAAVVRELESKPRAAAEAGAGLDEGLLALLAGGGDIAAVRARARELEALGRDDRAARLYFAAAARSPKNAQAKADLEAGLRLFATAAQGLTPREAEALRRALFSMPDPFPLDLASLDALGTEDEDFPMDMLALFEINRRLVAQEALPDLLGAIVDSALHVTGAERGFVALEVDGEIAIQTALDSRRGDIAEPEVELSHSIVRQALSKSGVLRFSNAVDDPELADAPSVAALELRSILCAPFDIERGSRGVVYVDHRLRAGAFDERAERLLGLLAGQAALAVRQVRRMAEIKRLNKELEHQVAHKETDLQAARTALRAASVVPPASGLVGESLPMRAVHEWIARAAPSKLPVLVIGDSGTGKELAARALHAQSARAEGPFVAENCAALPETLIEAELFGYKKGAYTGADADRPGLFERASGGTLFLDEIGELPLELQAKLLRVLETGEVRRLGDSVVRRTDVRLVAATNRDLDLAVREQRFRADLMYRLDALRIAMPTLEQRVDDIPRLVAHFLRLEEAKSGVRRAISAAVVSKLCTRSWPGNVRELANEVARLCVLSNGDIDDPALVRAARRTSGAGADKTGVRPLAELERDAILQAIEEAGGDKGRAAEMLGISRAKIYQRIKDWREAEVGSDEEATSAS
ncbi:MAG: sigma 54-interacting transcriptional regulator [Planctomycetes bacterium]|nr:sigma 54-interacting transcriptional regulator [Planctomycetota bacterium]